MKENGEIEQDAIENGNRMNRIGKRMDRSGDRKNR